MSPRYVSTASAFALGAGVSSCLLWAATLLSLDRFLLLPSWPDHLRVIVWPDRIQSALCVVALITLPFLVLSWYLCCRSKGVSTVDHISARSLLPLVPLPLTLVPFFFWPRLPDSLPANLLFFGTIALAATVLFIFLREFVGQTIMDRALILTPPGRGTPVPLVERPRALFRLLAITTLLSFLFFWGGGIYFGRCVGDKGGDAGHFIIQAESLYQDHDLDIANNFDAVERRLLHRRGPQIMHISPNARDGHSYSWHSFGLPLLLAPLVSFGSVGLHGGVAFLAALGICGGLLACLLLGVRSTTALAMTSLFALSTFWAVYSFQILPECAGAAGMVWILVAILLLPRRPRLALVLMLVACLSLPWLYVRFVPPAGIGALVFLIVLLRSPLHRRQKWWLATSFILVCLCGGAAYFAVQFSMFRGGYASPNDSRMLLSYVPGIWKILVSDKGVAQVLPLFPFMLLATCRIWATEPAFRPAAAMAILSLLAVLITSCSFSDWAGGAVMPGRYLMVTTLLLLPFTARYYDQAGGVVRWFFLFLSLVSSGYLLLLLVNLPEIGIHFADPPRILAFYRPLLDGLANPFHSPGDLYGILFVLIAAAMVFSPFRAIRLHVLLVLFLVTLTVTLHRSDQDFVHSPWRRTVLNNSMRQRNSAMFRRVDTRRSLVHMKEERWYPVSDVFAGRLPKMSPHEATAIPLPAIGPQENGSCRRRTLDFVDGPGPRSLCVATCREWQEQITVRGSFAHSGDLLLLQVEERVGNPARCLEILLPGQGNIQVVVDQACGNSSCAEPALFWYPLSRSFLRQAHLSEPSPSTW